MTATDYQAHDAAVHAGHEKALARGEQRILYLTEEGMLHSYAKDEIGGPPNSSKHWWSMFPALLFFLAATALTLYVLVEPTFHGEEPWWRALYGTAVFAPFIFGCLWSLRKDYRAHKNRKQRGVPAPLRFPGATTTLPESYTESKPMSVK
jgi:hypothetical protein